MVRYQLQNDLNGLKSLTFVVIDNTISAVHCYKKGNNMAKHRRDQIRKEVISEIFHHLNQNLFKQCRCAICIRFRKSFDGIIRDAMNKRMTKRRIERGISFDDWSLEAQVNT